jgi:hypothetical protein
LCRERAICASTAAAPPPRRARILEWQKEQEFPICPDPDDPDACNVYKERTFPDEVYGSIAEYCEQKAEGKPSSNLGRRGGRGARKVRRRWIASWYA